MRGSGSAMLSDSYELNMTGGSDRLQREGRVSRIGGQVLMPKLGLTNTMRQCSCCATPAQELPMMGMAVDFYSKMRVDDSNLEIDFLSRTELESRRKRVLEMQSRRLNASVLAVVPRTANEIPSHHHRKSWGSVGSRLIKTCRVPRTVNGLNIMENVHVHWV